MSWIIGVYYNTYTEIIQYAHATPTSLWPNREKTSLLHEVFFFCYITF